jgi:16S rRNA processing protein RimM
VIRPHGLDGVLRIFSYAESEKIFLKEGRVFLRCGEEEALEHKVRSIKPHKNIFLLDLEALGCREDAEKYRGASIFVRKDALGREEDDEYFWYELLGLGVYLNTGEYVGEIMRIFPAGGHDIYVVARGKREMMVPAVHEFVESIDLENRRMIIRETEGLLDLNEV